MDSRIDRRSTSRIAWAFAALAAGWSVVCFGGDSSEADKWKTELAERARWWSLQPPHAVSPPSVKDPAWQAEPVDRFILSELTKAALPPAPPADAATLARRLSFVLTGLPPEPATVTRFVDAYAGDPETALRDQVDEWLASPHFGERFARHWMDVVRYTDTYGYEWDNPVKGSWEYRDYLIRAFNADIGFDQLIREQIAGDLLPEPRIDEAAGFNESLIGPTFYHLGEHRHGTSIEFNGVHQEMVNNKIDAFSKAFLAMTVACARCHDHKLDAISQADYYALAGVFMTPRWTSRVIDAPGKQAAAIGQLRNLRERIQETMAAAWPSTAAGKLRPDTLQAWAVQHRESLQSATHGQVTYPMAKWLDVPDAGAATRWKELAAEWRNARAERQKSNAETFTVVTDFATPGFPTGWVTEGDGIEQGWVADGTLLVRLEGETLIDSFLPRGYHTHALSPKFPGALRLPAEDQIPGAFVSLQLQGAEWAGRLVAPQNAFQSEGVTFFDPEAKANWLATPDSPLKNGVSRVLVEFATASLNPNFPPRTGLARAGKTKLPDEDLGFDKRSWFSLTGIVSHDQPGAPADPMDAYVRLFEEESLPATAEEGWGRMATWLSATVDRWAAGKSAPGDAGLLNWMLAEGWLPNRMEDVPEAAEWVTRYREVESSLIFPRTANTMDEREIGPIDYRLNLRGNVDEEGPAIPRRFLEVFDHQQTVGDAPDSGRLALANYLGSDRSPQTARVYVNRVWQWVFGTGLVATPDDFGKLGDRPSHPDLFDWLAVEFMQEGWSTKRLIRRLVLSQTFRQSGRVDQAAVDHDPDNRLWHHYPTRRLEAESIRDAMLAVSGRLDPTLFGRPIDPPRAKEDPAKRLFSGPLDGNGRRSLYLKMSIMDPPKFLVGFNLPDLKLPSGKRDETNVPTQALVLLNDPLVKELSRQWAQSLVAGSQADPEDTVARLFLAAYGRVPDSSETNRWVSAWQSFRANSADDLQAWSEITHLIFNTKEFLYVR